MKFVVLKNKICHDINSFSYPVNQMRLKVSIRLLMMQVTYLVKMQVAGSGPYKGNETLKEKYVI